MKKLILLIISMCILSSCSEKLDDEQLKVLIKNFELNTVHELKHSMIISCYGKRRCLEIPKIYKEVYVISDGKLPGDNGKEVIDNLSVSGMVSAKLIKDDSYYPVVSKSYNILLSEIGNKFLIGETSDSYLLALKNMDEIELQSTLTSKDTLMVSYIIKPNRVYEVLQKTCLFFEAIDTNTVKILRRENDWAILMEER